MGKSNRNKRPTARMADRADRHDLYEAAVQNVAEECTLIDFLFRQIRGRQAKSLREDFCGTASAACEWVRMRKSNCAFGIDIDPDVLSWGREHRVGALKKNGRQRISLVQGDVLEVETPPVDVVVAFNFSYWVLRRRAQLLSYFERVFEALNEDGIFFLDTYGGSDSFTVVKERTEMEGFTYVWHQASYEPVTGRMQTYIHFEFPDGSRIRRAFSYDWRVWTLPEIRDLLEEAGFTNVTTWFEIRDDDGEGLGEWLPDPAGPNDPVWIANITAEKPA